MLGKFKDIVTSGAALDGLKEVLTPGAAIEKARQLLRDFNETVPTLKALGLSVSDMSFKMGIPPEIAASLLGSIDALDSDGIKTVKERHQDNRETDGSGPETEPRPRDPTGRQQCRQRRQGETDSDQEEGGVCRIPPEQRVAHAPRLD